MANESIRFAGMDETISAVNKLTEAYRNQIPRLTVSTLTEFALESLGRLTPGTGVYARAWAALTNLQASGAFYTLIRNSFEDTPQGETVLHVLEGGSRPHEIRPRFANALRFSVQAGPEFSGLGSPLSADVKTVFAKKVNHPGTKPYRMVEETTDRMEAFLDEVEKRVADDVASLFR